jgi:hypothetical protein
VPSRSTYRGRVRPFAVVVALFALVVGGVVPAQAEGTATITGTIVVPSGVTMDASSAVYVQAYRQVDGAWRSVASHHLWYTDTFELDGLTDGVSYLLTLERGGSVLAAGFYGGQGADVLPTAQGAPLVTAPATGISIGGVLATSISGTVAGAGAAADYLSVTARAPRTTPLSWVGDAYGTVTGTTFSVGGLHPLRPVRLRFEDQPTDASPGIDDGYYAGPGVPVSGDVEAGVLVTPGTAGLPVALQPGARGAGTIERAATGVEGVFSTQLDLFSATTTRRIDYTYAVVPDEAWSDLGSDADFSIRELPVGTYRIGYNRESGATMYVPSFYTGTASPPRVTTLADAKPVSIASGSSLTDLRLPLQTCASISGTIDDRFVSSDPDAQTAVVLFNDEAGLSGRSWHGTGSSFTVGGLVPGTYHAAIVTTPGWVETPLPDLRITGCTASSGVKLGADLLTSTVAPTVTGTPKLGSALTVTAGSWSQPDVTRTRQWLRDGVAISGATQATYTAVVADVNHRLSVRETATKPGFPVATRTSVPTALVAAGTITNTSKPRISGTAVVAGTLTATAGTWSPTAATTLRWLRNGALISGATGSTYKLTAADAGKKLSVRATATKAGYAAATATSLSTTAVARSKATATTTLSATTARTTSRVVVTVRVTTPGVATPTGTVRIKVGVKSYSVSLTAAHKGRVALKLPALKKGTYYVTSVFTPSGATATATTAATARAVTLRIR